jgi:hypothetical protein
MAIDTEKQKFQKDYVRLLPGLQTKGRELSKSTSIAAGIEPLEETPYKATPKVFHKATDLLPVMEGTILI